jgi:hypothetical protein
MEPARPSHPVSSGPDESPNPSRVAAGVAGRRRFLRRLGAAAGAVGAAAIVAPLGATPPLTAATAPSDRRGAVVGGRYVGTGERVDDVAAEGAGGASC